MEFNKVFDQSWYKVGSLARKVAAEASLYPDSPLEIWASPEFIKDSKSALALLCVLPLVNPSTRNYAQIQNIRLHVAKMASNYRLEGDWKTVGYLLEKDTQLSIYFTWKTVMDTMNENDWFGNMVPLLVSALKAIRWRTVYLSVVDDKRGVAYPQRKRGYNDKGSWDVSQQRLPIEYWVVPRTLEDVIPREPRAFEWYGRFQRRGSG